MLNMWRGIFYSGNSVQSEQQTSTRFFADCITSESRKEDVAMLLAMIRDELKTLDIPEGPKEEVAAELEAAATQVKKAEPDKPKIAKRLKDATAALKEVGGMGVQAVALGKMIGKAILWCGENWPP